MLIAYQVLLIVLIITFGIGVVATYNQENGKVIAAVFIACVLSFLTTFLL